MKKDFSLPIAIINWISLEVVLAAAVQMKHSRSTTKLVNG